jgi:hypothetical protein
MTWTVACFCGNVYTAPPDRCDACASTLSHAVPGDTPNPRHGDRQRPFRPRCRRSPHGDPRIRHA